MESEKQEQPEQQANPSPSDVKASVDNHAAKTKAAQSATVRKAVAVQEQRSWGFFGARSLSKAAEYGGETIELKFLRKKLREQAKILEEFELTPEELASMTK